MVWERGRSEYGLISVTVPVAGSKVMMSALRITAFGSGIICMVFSFSVMVLYTGYEFRSSDTALSHTE